MGNRLPFSCSEVENTSIVNAFMSKMLTGIKKKLLFYIVHIEESLKGVKKIE